MRGKVINREKYEGEGKGSGGEEKNKVHEKKNRDEWLQMEGKKVEIERGEWREGRGNK